MKLLVLSILVSSAGLTTAQFIKNYAQIDAEIRSKFATLSSPRLNSVSGSLIKYLDPVSNLLESLQRGEELLLDDDDNWASHVSRTCLDDSKFLVHSLRNYFRGILLYLAHNNDTDADGIEKAKEGLGNITQNFWALKGQFLISLTHSSQYKWMK